MCQQSRCGWAESSGLMQHYHDEEWGVPVHEDQKLFEFITLDAFQAGLSWSCILNKRENFRAAFDNFDPIIIASYSEEKVEELKNNAGIVRNKAKIEATIQNAHSFLRLQKEYGTFDRYIWKFVNYQPIINTWTQMRQIPASSLESDMMSKELKKQGFKFVGTTICYAFMQAAGMVNDHVVSCFRYEQVLKR